MGTSFSWRVRYRSRRLWWHFPIRSSRRLSLPRISKPRFSWHHLFWPIFWWLVLWYPGCYFWESFCVFWHHRYLNLFPPFPLPDIAIFVWLFQLWEKREEEESKRAMCTSQWTTPRNSHQKGKRPCTSTPSANLSHSIRPAVLAYLHTAVPSPSCIATSPTTFPHKHAPSTRGHTCLTEFKKQAGLSFTALKCKFTTGPGRHSTLQKLSR